MTARTNKSAHPIRSMLVAWRHGVMDEAAADGVGT